ncbi:MAG TPA: hypothetical protein VN047_05665 [Sphingopyxis sp.]|uniref:hypothetical protein n=1 Tax=Sphingopyxis sp. TaxID=1908224 RepID=UPI002BBB235F|nr:hypothetical protein [Sphingopyxis sp.]HWW56361.1 hypothetical protein [Sphingopyxis sp.]
MGKIIQAIVRGPENYFDGELHPPGAIVDVDEDFVSDEDEIEKEIEVTLPTPVVVDGKLQRTFKETVRVPVRFRPLGSEPTIAGPVTTAEIATGGDLDRLNVTDFLKGGTDDIVKAIVNGNVDDHLGAIEQGELGRKGPARAAVKDAIAARLAAKAG